MHIYARQGDLVFEKQTVSGELTKMTNTVLSGRDSDPHTVRGTVLARQDGLNWSLRVAETMTVDHAGRHQPITLEPGDYVVRPLRERGSGADRQVVD